VSASGAVVAVVAHPDDESLIAGGTLALSARAGARCGVVSLTRGERGPISAPGLAGSDDLGEVREAELRAAGAALGVAWTACLRHPDGELPWVDEEQAADELAARMEADRPSVVLTFGSDGVYGHPDHAAARAIAGAALDRLGLAQETAVYETVWPPELMADLAAATRERGLPVGLWGLEPQDFGSHEAAATVAVDVRPALAQKLAALRAHRTQLGADHLLTALPDDLAERFLGHELWRRAGGEGAELADLLGAQATPTSDG
jgi:LmbE family N-acetylglucosaminyl deacetylase